MTKIPLETRYQGDTAALDFICIEPDGSRLNLTDCTITWSLSDPADLDAPILTKTTGSGITVLSATDGTCRVIISAGDLDTIGTFAQELEVEHSDGAKYTYAQGLFVVKGTATPT